MTETSGRVIRIAITKVSYDLVCNATADTGVARLVGAGTLGDDEKDLGPVELTFWGATPDELRERAKNWPARFDAVSGAHFGVSAAGEASFDIFLSGERFFRLLDLAHGSRRAMIRLTCDLSEAGDLELVREMEISASRG